MPELPEVQTVINSLAPRIVSKTIRAVDLIRADILTPPGFDLLGGLLGRTVADISRRGKRIVITLDDANRFYIHLGMTGRLTIEPPGSQRIKHTHFLLAFDGFEMHFRDPRRFGGIWWLGQALDPSESLMGPEPLTLDWKALKFRLAMTSKFVKVALLDQRIVAGLGNIYADESLFGAGVHPLTPANQLDDEQIKKLTRSIKKVLRLALAHRGSTLRDYVDAEGGRGAFQNLHQVYDRAGEPCRVCGRNITRIVLGGRSTCFCQTCQPRPRKKAQRKAKTGASRGKK
jgi:formamidopyrimidine-DNA glycosylase